jgi:subtilisin family serine protease
VVAALTFALLCGAAQAGTREAARQRSMGSDAEFEPYWFLIRLDEPLTDVEPDGSFALATGNAELDAAIRDHGVTRIDFALTVAATGAADPEAFRRWGFDRTYRFHVGGESNVLDLVERFAVLTVVDYAEPDFLLEADATVPDDTRFDEQWALDNIDAPEAWDISTGSASVLIAVNDSGIDLDHPDLDGILWANPAEIPGNGLDDDACGYVDDVHGWNFLDGNNDVDDLHGHGTKVSSYAVAETDNAQGIAGVCWDCRIMSVKRASDSHSSLTDATIWAVDHGASVINASYSSSGSWTLLNGIGYATDAGVTFVSSMGNDSARIRKAPAMYVETLAVGATNVADKRASFSNWEAHNDVVAPGDSVLGAEMGGGYGNGTGTSYSTPHVAGLAGLIRSVNPSAGLHEVRHLIRSAADDQVGLPAEDTPGFDEYHGWGRVNARRTLDGTQAGMTLRVEGKTATRLHFGTTNPLAVSWDFVRGDLSALSEDHLGVDVGALTCLENDSPDPDTAGNEDTAIPAPGEGFFYLARFNAAPGAGSYGGSSRNRDRMVIRHRLAADWFTESDFEGGEMGVTAPAGDVNGDGFGDLIVGAAPYDFYDNQDGLAEVYLGSATGLAPSPHWRHSIGQWGAHFGSAVASAGDVDGDGYDDVIVGAPLYDNPVYNEGGAFLYLGSPSGLSTTEDWSADEADQSSAYFGELVAGAGDVDGDGYDDILVSAWSYDGGETNEGRAYLYYGSRNGPGNSADWTWEPDQADANLATVNSAGDVNGDGYDDFVLGIDGYDNGEIDEGRVVLFYGSPSGPGSQPDVVLEIDSPGAHFGWYVDGAGDVNGDTYDDVIVGAPYYTNGETEEGAAFVYLGSAAGLATVAAWSVEGGQAYAHLGKVASSSAGDCNNDTFDDVVVGSRHFDGLRSDEGRSQLFLGSPTGLSSTPVWTGTSGQTGSNFGAWSAGAGDVNGDGYDDVTVGAYAYDNGEYQEGRVFVFHGPLSDTSTADCPE